MTRTRPARADVRTAVLSAARDVFGELGYHRASLDLIAARAGFSKGAVYSNFAGKDDLFLALLAEEVAQLGRRLAAASRASGDTDTDLASLATALLGLVLDGRAQLVFAEFRATAARDQVLAQRLATVRDELVSVTAGILEAELAERGLVLAVDGGEAATVLLTLANGLALEHVGHDQPVLSVATLSRVLRSLVETQPDPQES